MNDNYKIPVPKFLVKELTFWGLPYNLAVLMGGVMVLSAVVLKNIPIFIIFFIIYPTYILPRFSIHQCSYSTCIDYIKLRDRKSVV